MRIAIANSHLGKLGGTETYLNEIIPALARHGHRIAFLCEHDAPSDRAPICLPESAPVWCGSSLGVRSALAAMRAWQPDLICVNRLSDPALEAGAMAIAPSICFVHDHHRTCLGVKAYTRPRVCPCARTFGWQCLALYYPRRCGRASVAKVMSTYAARSRQLKLLRKYNAIVTFSEYMKMEVLKHGCDPRLLHHINFGFEADETGHPQLREKFDEAREEVALLFAGRMEQTKGGLILLDSLPRVARTLRRPIKLRLAGEGYSRVRWEQHAKKISTREPAVEIEFSGWMDETSLAKLMDRSDLLVVPSLWPEPLGRIGIEAGLRGLPAAAFAVGGIPEWLSDGFNGHLAPANPPSAAGLGDAVVKCLRDPDHHARLRKGATESARKFRRADHVARLQQLFTAVGKAGIDRR